jgi:hypothetical protein
MNPSNNLPLSEWTAINHSSLTQPEVNIKVESYSPSPYHMTSVYDMPLPYETRIPPLSYDQIQGSVNEPIDQYSGQTQRPNSPLNTFVPGTSSSNTGLDNESKKLQEKQKRMKWARKVKERKRRKSLDIKKDIYMEKRREEQSKKLKDFLERDVTVVIRSDIGRLTEDITYLFEMAIEPFVSQKEREDVKREMEYILTLHCVKETILNNFLWLMFMSMFIYSNKFLF